MFIILITGNPVRSSRYSPTFLRDLFGKRMFFPKNTRRNTTHDRSKPVRTGQNRSGMYRLLFSAIPSCYKF
ncbi:hypothetical protein ACFO4P_00485 [Epilithonimonas pallida]|uniref:hypothetical protein n=1 Tax=Epilithonimonas pallida TaxID=373671 RepID=UPI0024B640C3|nr:hypothetical protein [Epilithonimonas pallida]